MSRSPIRSAILVLQALVALAAVAGTALGTAVYVDGRGNTEGFAELAGFLGLLFAAWCLVVLVAAAATLLRVRRDGPGVGPLAAVTGVLGLLPVILLGAGAPALLVLTLPSGTLIVLGVLETAGRKD